MAPPAPPPPPAAVLRGHRSDVQCLAVLPRRLSVLARGGAAAALEGTGMDLLLASGDAEGEVRIWDLQQRRALFSRVLHDSQAGVLHLTVVGALGATGGPALLSQGRDGVVKAWPLLLGEEAAVDAAGASADANADANADTAASAAAALPSEPSMELRGGCYSFCRFALAAVDREADDPFGWGVESEGEEEEEEQEEGVEAAAEDDEEDNDDRFPPQTRAVGFRAPRSEQRAAAKVEDHREQHCALRPGLLKLALREEEEDAAPAVAAAAAAPNETAADEGGEDLTEAQELALMEGRPITRGTNKEYWLAMPAPDGTSLALWRLGGGGDDDKAAAPRAPARLLCQRERNAQGTPLHGMVMAVSLLRRGGRGRLHALVGYEDGVVGLWRCGGGGGGGKGGGGGGGSSSSSSSSSRLLSSARVHDEPVMCVAVLPPLPGTLAPPLRQQQQQQQQQQQPELRVGVSGAADDRLAIFTLSLFGGGGGDDHEKAEEDSSASAHEAVEPALRLPMPRGGVAQVSAAWWRPPPVAAAAGRRPSAKLVPVAAAAAWDGRVRVWALSGGGAGSGATSTPLAVLRHHGPPAAAAAVEFFSARGAAGGGDGEKGEEGDDGALWLASGGRDGTVAIWDALLPRD